MEKIAKKCDFICIANISDVEICWRVQIICRCFCHSAMQLLIIKYMWLHSLWRPGTVALMCGERKLHGVSTSLHFPLLARSSHILLMQLTSAFSSLLLQSSNNTVSHRGWCYKKNWRDENVQVALKQSYLARWYLLSLSPCLQRWWGFYWPGVDF